MERLTNEQIAEICMKRKKCERFVDDIILFILTNRIEPDWFMNSEWIDEITTLSKFRKKNTIYLMDKMEELKEIIEIYLYNGSKFYEVHEPLYKMFPTLTGDIVTDKYKEFLRNY